MTTEGMTTDATRGNVDLGYTIFVHCGNCHMTQPVPIPMGVAKEQSHAKCFKCWCSLFQARRGGRL